MATCAKCGASIMWFKLATSGRMIPVNDGRVPNGNIEIESDGAHVVKPSLMTARFLPHYATCPDWRKEQAQKTEAKRAAKRATAARQMNLFGGKPDAT